MIADLPGYGWSAVPQAQDDHAPYTKRAMAAVMVEAMEAAGTSAHLIFAYRKTGMMMGTENAGLWTDAEIEEWNAAIAEYELLHGPIKKGE